MTEMHAPSMRDYARILWRRRWIILILVVVAPIAAFVISSGQAPTYEASAQVLLSNQNLAATLTGTGGSIQSSDPVRDAQTQAELASVPAVAQAVAAGNPDLHLGAGAISRAVTVSPANNADILEFRARDRRPETASRLATEYARQYTLYRRRIDTAAISRALAEAERHLSDLRSAHQTRSALYAELADKVQTLQTMDALETSNAFLVRSAAKGVKVSPQPIRNAALAAALALVVGLIFAFARETFDTRVHSGDEVTRALHLPLLARLPEPPKRLAAKNELVSIAAPTSTSAEAFRLLRTNLDFVNLERNVKSFLVTSAVQGEGKSTTAANLAVTFARSGRNVVLVDLDLRRPRIHSYFGLDPEIGLTSVALGQVALHEALHPVFLGREGVDGDAQEPDLGRNGGAANGRDARSAGILHVLGSGPTPPNPGEFIEAQAVGRILREVCDHAQVVVVDAPPILSVGDALTLSSRVDGILVVTRLTSLRTPMLRELRRALDVSPAEKLGFAIAGADADDAYGGGYYAYYSAASERGSPTPVS